MADTVQFLQLNVLQPNPFQPRSQIDREQLEDLVNSIKEHGILEPLIIAQTPAGYQIIAGERRWRAAQVVGLTEVPVLIKKTSPKGMLEMALVENIQRVDLDPMERVTAFDQLKREFGYTYAVIGQKVGKSESYVKNTMRLLDLPDALKDGLSGGLISEGHARALLGIDDEKTMIECYKQVLKESASVRRTEDLARRYKAKSGQKKRSMGSSTLVNQEIDYWKTKLAGVFKTESKVDLVRSMRQTKVTLVFNGTPQQTQDDLQKVLSLIKTYGDKK